jgi:hypothetical protein
MNLDVPLVFTSKGNLPLSDLEYRSGWADENGAPAALKADPAAVVFWEEHWHQGECVKRSAHALMREGSAATGDVSGF